MCSVKLGMRVSKQAYPFHQGSASDSHKKTKQNEDDQVAGGCIYC